MNEKTLLYSALGVTVVAATLGIYKAKVGGSAAEAIAPIATLDAPEKGISEAEVPIRLTASDGTGLKLVALRARAAVEDPLALTELHLTFENPQDRVLEGTFRITLPQGASLSRLAMKIGDAWQEGEVVEKQAARRAYEDFLHRKQDPALMEQGAGNEYSARVFPIPARGTKEIIVTYAEALEVGGPYVLPLRGLPELGALDVNVRASGSSAGANGGKTSGTFTLHQQSFTPASDFVVDGKQIPRSPGLRSAELAIARVVPFASSRPEPVGSAVVLVDTSASRGLGIGEQVRMLESILKRLPGDTAVNVACFDQDVAPIFEGRAKDFSPKEVEAIKARGALGASNFEQAIDWAVDQSKRSKATRVVLLTDGVATAGETDAQKLRMKVEALRDSGVTRMDAVAIGGIRDDGFLRTVVRGVLDRDGVVLDAKLGAEAIARRLVEATSSGIAVKVEGAKWSWPEKLDGLQAGDEVLVYAELDGGAPMRIDVGGQQFSPDLRTLDRPLVERAWAQAKIQSLIEAPKESPVATQQQIIALSTRHRVLSPHTAFLVLETEADYRRFNIDRSATVDILTVEDGRVAVVQAPRGWEEERNKVLRPAPVAAKGRARSEEAAPAAPAPAATAMDMMDMAEERLSEAVPSQAPADEASRRAAASAARRRDELLDDPVPSVSLGGLGLAGAGEGGGGQADGRGGLLPGLGAGGSGQGLGRASSGESASGPERERRMAPSPAAPPPPPPPRPAAEPNPCSPGDPLCTPLGAGTDRASASNAAVRAGSLEVERGISSDQVQGVMRGAIPRLRTCYVAELERNPSTNGRLAIRFVVRSSGDVASAELRDAPGSDAFAGCVSAVAKSLRFSALDSGEARFTQTFDLVGGGSGSNSELVTNVPKALPYEGRFKTVMEALRSGDKSGALTEARRWHNDEPGDVLSLVALGEAFEANDDLRSAARAYGSILELFSFRADSRRFAGERLERLNDAQALALAVDTYAKAAEQRPDHPASHRLYAFALLKKGEHEKAFEAMKAGAGRTYPMGRFRGVDRILKEDLGLIAAAWMAQAPERTTEIRTKLRESGGIEENVPSLRFVLNWETDANDVDFHIHDGKGGHAYYAHKQLPSGGELYADVTTGYGPECFTIRGPRDQRAYPYRLQAHYYSRGPMGYGMGKLQVVEHDGKGKLSFEERPFVVMIDRAYVDMGSVEKPSALSVAAAMK